MAPSWPWGTQIEKKKNVEREVVYLVMGFRGTNNIEFTSMERSNYGGNRIQIYYLNKEK